MGGAVLTATNKDLFGDDFGIDTIRVAQWTHNRLSHIGSESYRNGSGFAKILSTMHPEKMP